jgi:hypothetical protein
MIVEAKCIQHAFESRGAREYVSGSTYQLDFSKPEQRKLADLKTYTGEFIFQFDRLAANDPKDGLYFCTECLTRFDTLNLLGTHVNRDHKGKGLKQAAEAEPEPEAEEAKPANRRPPHCKGCGEPFANVRVLVAHKLVCPGKATTEVVSPEASDEEVSQAPLPA